jgi:hypothetical protein
MWATVKNWAADRNVAFRMEDLIRLTDEKFASINKDNWKLRCINVIAHLNKSQEAVMWRMNVLTVTAIQTSLLKFPKVIMSSPMINLNTVLKNTMVGKTEAI